MVIDGQETLIPGDDARRIHELRCEFERAWESGSSPRIEEYLARVGDDLRFAAFRELLKAEIEHRRGTQEQAPTDNYLERFPEYREVILVALIGTADGQQTIAHEPAGRRSGLHVRCPHCHNPIELVPDANLDNVECQSCGNTFGLTSDPAPASSSSSGFLRFGHFRLEQRLGMGAFGTVWKAHDTELDRAVAIKTPRAQHLDKQQQESFLREARAAAQLRHSNIVPVYEVGREGDTVYIVSEFVRGVTLSEWMARKQPTARESVALCAKVAEALHHAHEQGVIHRDLKPANVIIDEAGEPHIMDFGLARRETREITMTVEGKILGTPAYMPPEQARGDSHLADRRSDVYSLGVMLFELLTGELPFRGNIRMLIQQVLEEEAPSPHKLNASVPKDLETITLKCLQKDPKRRFDSAQELAEECRRFLAGEPILSRPISRVERGWRWCKRHPHVTTLSSALLVLILCAAIIAPIVAVRQAILRQQAEQVTARLDEKNEELETQLTRALIDRAITDFESGRPERGIAYLASAFENASVENPLRRSARNLLASWALSAPRQLVHDRGLQALAFSRDGKSIIAATTDGLQSWDLASGNPIDESPRPTNGQPMRASVSPDGRVLMTLNKIVETVTSNNQTTIGSRTTPQLWNMRTGKPVGPALRYKSSILAYALSPDGRTLLTGNDDKTSQLWDTTSLEPIGEPLRQVIGDEDAADPIKSNLRHAFKLPFSAVAFSTDGTTLLTASTEGFKRYAILRYWNAETRLSTRGLVRISDGSGAASCLKFSPDATRLFVGFHDQPSQMWDVEAGKPLGKPIIETKVWGNHTAVFALDGRTVATGGTDGVVRLWDTSTGESRGAAMRHGHSITAIAFSPAGDALLTGSADRTARLWDARTGDSLSSPMHHESVVTAVAFSPDGETVTTGSYEGVAKVWDAAGNNAQSLAEVPLVRSIPSGQIPARIPLRVVAFSPDGRTVLIAGNDDTLWDVRSDKGTGKRLSLDLRKRIFSSIDNIAFTTNGRVTTVDGDDTVRLWDGVTGQLLSEPIHLQTGFRRVTLSPDGTKLSIHTYETVERSPTGDQVRKSGIGPGQLWDVMSGRPLGKPWTSTTFPIDAFSHDGRIFLTAGNNRVALLWSGITGERLDVSLNHASQYVGDIVSAALSADGAMALTTDSRTVQFWNTKTGKRIGKAAPHAGEMVAAAFSVDSQAAVTLGKEVRLWNPTTGQLLVPPLHHDGEVKAAIFSPDSTSLVTCGSKVLLWDVRTGKPRGNALPHDGPASTAAFSPDGACLITGGDDGVARLWSIPQLEGGVEEILAVSKAQSALKVDALGVVNHMSQAEWMTARRRVAETAARAIVPVGRAPIRD